MDNMRILKGYSKEERKELEEAKDNGFLSVITLFCSIKRDDNNCHVLYGKYYRDDTNGNNQMARDIADYYAGVAKFPDKKYYVKLIKNSDFSYLYRSKLTNFLILGICSLSQDYQNEFTEQEIKAIDPRYMAFAVPVEGINED